MATILSKTFNIQQGAVVLQVQDAVLKQTSSHTIYVANVPDVNAAIQAVLTQVDADAQAIESKFTAAGWNGNPGS